MREKDFFPYCDFEMGVNGHPKLLKAVPVLVMVSY